jgi:exodeoxyribonuclease VII small subunit
MDEKPVEDLTFEEAMTALQQVVEQIESNELPLDQTLQLFERGTQLARRCDTLLEQAELRVVELNQVLGEGSDAP